MTRSPPRSAPTAAQDQAQALARRREQARRRREERGPYPGREQRLQAERCLAQQGASAPDRVEAARTLGRLAHSGSYAVLLDVLGAVDAGAESPSRVVALEVLLALGAVGVAHRLDSGVRGGRAPLNAFMQAHLDDPELLDAAFRALAWTGPVNDTGDDAWRLFHDAKAAGNKAPAEVAHRWFHRLTER